MGKKAFITAVLICISVFVLCGCAEISPQASESVPEVTLAPAAETALPPAASRPSATAEPTVTPAPFPYADKQGRTRHQLVINGEIVETPHLPFSLSGEEGAYLPLEDVLSSFGIPCLINETSRSATGRVNGKVFTAQARIKKMTVGKSSLESEAMPYYIDGCLYVPSFLFMELLDATVDFTPDRSGATLSTDITIDAADSTLKGLKLPDNTYGDGEARLVLSASERSACAKLFYADATGNGEEVLVALLAPGESVTLSFPAGTYILKLAYGDTWLGDAEAFGEQGVYSSTEAYTFEKGGKYELATSSTDGDFYTDSQDGFTGSGN